MTSSPLPPGAGQAEIPEQAAAKPKRRRGPSHLLTVVIVLVVSVAAGGFASVLAYHDKSAVHRGRGYAATTADVTFDSKDQPTVSLVDINAYLLAVDTDAQTAHLRLVFGYWEAHSQADSPVTPQKLAVSVLGTITEPTETSHTDANIYTFEANQQMRSVDVSVNLGDSAAQRYPFDSFAGFIAFSVADDQGKPVPSATAFADSADGWTTSLDDNLCDVVSASWYPFLSFGPNANVCAPDGSAQAVPGVQGLLIGIHREAISQSYAIFIMLLMWTLALTGVFTVITVFRNPNFEFDFLIPTYLAALLFAFPLIRGLLPGNPALGVLADFAAYFWVEAVVGASLIVLVVSWIRRTLKEHGGLDLRPAEEADRGIPSADEGTGNRPV